MKTQTIEIVDHGRGPQLSTMRITVLDVFYYLHRGYEFDEIHEIMPILSREEFDVVAEYVEAHRDELGKLGDPDKSVVITLRVMICSEQSTNFAAFEASPNVITRSVMNTLDFCRLRQARPRAEEFIERGIAAQQAKGLSPVIDESVPCAERIARLKKKYLKGQE